MITPEQGMAFMRQIGQMQRPGGGGIGAPPAGSPTQGLIARLMSDNPGGLLGTLLKGGNAPVNPGAPPPPGSPAYAPGGAGPAAPGMPPMMPGADSGAAPAAGGGFMDMFKGGGDMGGLGMLGKMFAGGAGGGAGSW